MFFRSKIKENLKLVRKAPIRRVLKRMGVRGAIKSFINSVRYTRSVATILCDKYAVTSIDRTTTISIPSFCVLGLTSVAPVVEPTYLSVEGTGVFEVTNSNRGPRFGAGTDVRVSGHLSIGDSWTGKHCRIGCREQVRIGDGCAISWNVDILDSNGGHNLFIDGERQPNAEPIIVGDNVWVGHNTIIKKGVDIGDGAVIGSGSVVTSDVPPNSLAAGDPAEVISTDVEWE